MILRLLLGGLLIASAIPAAAELPEPFAAQLRAAAIPEDAAGVVVQRLSDGATIVAHRADSSMQPASTLKLLTALVALERLGPAYRGRTQLRTRGEIVDGVLQGDLILRGAGDVDLDGQAFERLLQLVRLHGVREIRGDLVLDLTFFRPTRTDVGQPPFDEAPEFRYNVIPDALLLNTYLLQLDLDSDGESLRVRATPSLAGVTVESGLELIDRACEDWEDGWVTPAVTRPSRGAIRIRLQGAFPRRCQASTAVSVLDRVEFTDRLFRQLWTGMGGKFRGLTREGDTGPDSRLLSEHLSRSLAELTRDVNKRSDNPITRVVYLTLGALSASNPRWPTAERADAEVRAWFAQHGIDPDGLVLENGSGLSRSERIRPSQLAAALKAAITSDWAPEFLASLPIVALDGAMRSRLRDSPAAVRARIKTGTLRDVSAVAGYVKDEAGETYIVVAMLNHELATKKVARPILDALVDWVARGRTEDSAPARYSAH